MFLDGSVQTNEENVRPNSFDSDDYRFDHDCLDDVGRLFVEKWRIMFIIRFASIYRDDMVFIVVYSICEGCFEEMLRLVLRIKSIYSDFYSHKLLIDYYNIGFFLRFVPLRSSLSFFFETRPPIYFFLMSPCIGCYILTNCAFILLFFCVCGAS